ncbi:hypothetical protein [Leeia oryzae]|uniref:hypothetical protein n=1 Tax=Leeia oryzae TaxID=356662 RepID=UPI0003642C70|nr:hypothetical protein [Leeia oryzae]
MMVIKNWGIVFVAASVGDGQINGSFQQSNPEGHPGKALTTITALNQWLLVIVFVVGKRYIKKNLISTA